MVAALLSHLPRQIAQVGTPARLLSLMATTAFAGAAATGRLRLGSLTWLRFESHPLASLSIHAAHSWEFGDQPVWARDDRNIPPLRNGLLKAIAARGDWEQELVLELTRKDSIDFYMEMIGTNHWIMKTYLVASFRFCHLASQGVAEPFADSFGRLGSWGVTQKNGAEPLASIIGQVLQREGKMEKSLFLDACPTEGHWAAISEALASMESYIPNLAYAPVRPSRTS